MLEYAKLETRIDFGQLRFPFLIDQVPELQPIRVAVQQVNAQGYAGALH